MTGYVFNKTFHFVALKQNTEDVEHILTASLVVGFIYCKIASLIPIHISDKIDTICIVVSALILAYIFARIFRCKYLIYVLDFLKIRDTGNVYYWDDLMDNDYPMKVKVSYNENVYEGMLHNYESYSDEPHIVLTSYIVKDKSDNVLNDFRDDNTKIIILDTSKAEKVEVIYAKNSTICKDLRELCNSNSSLFNDRNNEEQD